MEVKNLVPLNNKECEHLDGGWLQVALVVGGLLLTAVPMIKSMWNSSSGSINFLGGIGAKWDESKANSDKNTSDLKKEINNLESKIKHLIPPFYEF